MLHVFLCDPFAVFHGFTWFVTGVCHVFVFKCLCFTNILYNKHFIADIFILLQIFGSNSIINIYIISTH